MRQNVSCLDWLSSCGGVQQPAWTRPYRYRPALFLVLAYALSWIAWFAGSTPGRGRSLVFTPRWRTFSGSGPAGAALLLVLTSGSKALKPILGPAVQLAAGKATTTQRSRWPYRLRHLLLILFPCGFASRLGNSSSQVARASSLSSCSLWCLRPSLRRGGLAWLWRRQSEEEFGTLPATLLFAALWCAWHAPWCHARHLRLEAPQ